MARKYDNIEDLRRKAVKEAGFVKVASHSNIAYQTVSRYAQGDPGIRGNTEMYIAMGTHNEIAHRIEEMEKEVRRLREYLPHLIEWVYQTQETV